MTDLFRRSLALMDACMQTHVQGGKVILEDKDGEQQRILMDC